MRFLTGKLRSQSGASAVEALFAMGAMLALLMIVVNIGGAFWNISVLNNMTQSASQTSQFIMDRSCSPGRVPVPGGQDACSKAYDRAGIQSNRIIDEQDNGLMMVGPGCNKDRDATVRIRPVTFIDGRPVLDMSNTACTTGDKIRPVPTSDKTVTLPDGSCLDAGWGYSAAAVSMPFRFWASDFLGMQGSRNITLGSAAMTASYMQPTLGEEDSAKC